MFEVVGLDPVHESVYVALVEALGQTPQELANARHVDLAVVTLALTQLEIQGLVSRTAESPVRFFAAPPDLAIESLLARRQAEFDDVRLAASRLTERFREARAQSATPAIVQVISGTESVRMHRDHAQRVAQKEVLLTDRPPYADGIGPSFNDEELAALERGVGFRCVYHAPGLDLPGHAEQMLRYVDAGERARVLADVPIKMLVVDAKLAIVPLSLDNSSAAVLVNGSTLITALTTCFEALWSRGLDVTAATDGAVTTGPDGAEPPTATERSIVRLLATGLKDDAIARQLGISHRTVVRHMDRIMTKLEVRTRFQAGLVAGRRGWI